MRRTDRERTDEEFFNEVFAKAETLFLALPDGEFPYCLPLNFARVGQQIYIHCAHTGKKIDCIAANPNVGFALVSTAQINREKYTTYYKSVCGHGRAAIITDRAEKRLALEAIGSRYDALCPRPASEAEIKRVAIIRIDILSLTGKCNDEKKMA